MPFGRTDDDRTSSNHLAVVLLPEDTDRDSVRAALGERGVQTSVHYPPIHTFSAYLSAQGRALPRTDAVAKRLLTLPLYGRLTDEQVGSVIEGLLSAVVACRR